MKTLFPIIAFFSAALFAPIDFARAQSPDFPGVERAMKPEDYEAAGLQKLTAEERARLNEFISNFVSSSTQKAVSAAVDKAVEARKAAPPDVIQSRIVGPFTGYKGNTTFTLENGQKWAQSQRDSMFFPKVESMPVLIVKGTFGYRMYFAGGGDIRVQRVR
ncbi:MAG: hypothetical protein ABJB22_02415 [Verrucomicrobiota bacterium]